MADFSYTPTREVVVASPGLIVTDLVGLERSTKPVGKQHKSLSGVTESVLHRRDIEWQVRVLPFDPVVLPYWREFEASCANGEEILVDLSDITGGPAAPFTATLKSGSFQEGRHEHFWYQVNFILIQA